VPSADQCGKVGRSWQLTIFVRRWTFFPAGSPSISAQDGTPSVNGFIARTKAIREPSGDHTASSSPTHGSVQGHSGAARSEATSSRCRESVSVRLVNSSRAPSGDQSG
jgi:hypothetical protein